MKTLLIATHLDYKYFANTRTSHLVEQFQKRFANITVMYKVHTAGDGLKGFLRSIVNCKVKRYKAGRITFIEVPHPFNPGNGLGLSILGIADAYAIPPSLLKRVLRRVLSFMGFFLELLVFPSFTMAYYLKDRREYDIFIGQGVWGIALGYLLKKSGRVKLLVSDDYDYSPGNQPISKFRRWFTEKVEILLLRRSDLIISVGELLGRLREKQAGKKVEVVSNGVNYELFKSAQDKSSHPPTLIYSGGVEAWSGLDIIIEALSKVREVIPDIRFLIIGHTTPAYKETLKLLIRKYTLERNVAYLGAKPYNDLPIYFREADIGMALYRPVEIRKYGFSLKVIEYMAAGLPVITTKGTQSEIVVREHDCGMAVDYNPAAISGALVTLLTDGDRFLKLSERAKIAAKRYDWEVLMERYYNLIRDCFNRGI